MKRFWHGLKCFIGIHDDCVTVYFTENVKAQECRLCGAVFGLRCYLHSYRD